MAQYLVGTSGWSYAHWAGVFYPEKWPKSRWLEYYATRFRTVEINATFYRTFQDQTYHKWRERVPEGFSYVLKAPRLITHRRYLEGAEDSIQRFWAQARLLEEKLGLILLQLAPNTPYDLERLRHALRAFHDPRKVAVEFRDDRWLTPEVREILAEKRAVFCAADSPKSRPLDWVTSETAYIRLHGRQSWYASNYSTEELKEIAGLARRMAKHGAKTVYAFFNNDAHGYAPKNALALQEMLGS